MTITISSVVVRAHPRKLARVRRELTAIPGVEIHADANDGRLVVVIDHGPGHSPPEVYARLTDIDGVVSLSLAYQYCDASFEQEPDV